MLTPTFAVSRVEESEGASGQNGVVRLELFDRVDPVWGVLLVMIGLVRPKMRGM